MNLSRKNGTIFGLILTSIIFNSCAINNNVEKRKYRNGYYIHSTSKNKTEATIAITVAPVKNNTKKTPGILEATTPKSENTIPISVNSFIVSPKKSTNKKTGFENSNSFQKQNLSNRFVISTKKNQVIDDPTAKKLARKRTIVIMWYVVGIILFFILLPLLIAVILHLIYRKQAIAAGISPKLVPPSENTATTKSKNGTIEKPKQNKNNVGSDKIYLSDGTVIIGKIIEEIPGLLVKIETSTGVQEIPYASISKIEKATK